MADLRTPTTQWTSCTANFTPARRTVASLFASMAAAPLAGFTLGIVWCIQHEVFDLGRISGAIDLSLFGLAPLSPIVLLIGLVAAEGLTMVRKILVKSVVPTR